MQRNSSVLSLVRIGLLAGAGALLMLWEVPILPSAPYLKWDAGDVPALLGGFAMGPWVGLMVSFLKVIVWSLTGKNATGVVGAAANIAAGGTLVVVASIIFSRLRNSSGLIVSLVVGSLAMTAVMLVANAAVFFPLWGIRGKDAMAALIGASLPFNLIKGVLTSTITFVLYKRMAVLLGSASLRPQAEPRSSR